MKIVLINCSPKKQLSASAYFLAIEKLFLKGKKVVLKLKESSDYINVFEELIDADSLILCLPLYSDGVPAQVLAFLEEAEKVFLKNDFKLNLYCIANNGFIDGKENEPLMQILENFCLRAKINWGGGIGIGGGVMLNIIRLVSVVQIMMLLFKYMINLFKTNVLLDIKLILSFLLIVGVFIFFHSIILFLLIRMATAINKKSFFGKYYTRALIPSFLFALIADIFIIVISFFQGGLFKGWLAEK